MMGELFDEPITVGISDEERRRREAQARRDDEARAAAAEALRNLQMPETPRLDAMASGEPGVPAVVPPRRPIELDPVMLGTPAPPVAAPQERAMPPMPVNPQGQPGNATMRMGQGAPATAESIAAFQQARDGQPAAPPATPRVDDRLLAAREELTARAQQPAAEPSAPDPRKPQMVAPGRMDEGLPSEDDIRVAGGVDAARTMLAAIANGMRAYAGNTGDPIMPRRESDELRQRREQGLERGRLVKGAELERAEEERRYEQERGDANRVAGQRESREQVMADAQRALAEARTSRERITAERNLESANPDSDTSRRARARYVLQEAMRRSQLERGRSRDEIVAEITSNIDGFSAYDIEQMEGNLPNMTIGTRSSRAGGGSGAPGGVPRAQRREMLMAAAREAGIPEAAALAMDDTALAREISQRSRNTDNPDATVELIPGVFGRAALVDGVEPRQLRTGFSQAQGVYGSLNRIREAARRAGVSGIVDPRVRASLAADMLRMQGLAAQAGGTGIINPSEMPRIDAAIPNATNIQQVTLGTIEQALDSFENDLERSMVSQLRTYGVPDAQIEYALAMMRRGGSIGGGGRRGGADASGARMYRVTHPRSRSTADQEMTEAQAEAARARGFRVEPQ